MLGSALLPNYQKRYVLTISCMFSLTATQNKKLAMPGSRKFCQREFNLNVLFFNVVDEGWEDPNTTISGPSSALKEMPRKWLFRWHADDGPTLNAGSGAV